MNVRTDRQTNGQTDGRTDGRMESMRFMCMRIYVVNVRTFMFSSRFC